MEQHSEERAPDNHWSAWMTTLQSVALRHFSRDKRTECEVTKRASLERREILAERRRLRMTAGSTMGGGRTSFLMARGPQQVLRIWQLGKVLKRHKRREMAERESLLLRDLSEPADEEPKPTSTVCSWPCLEEARVRRTEDSGTSMQVLRR